MPEELDASYYLYTSESFDVNEWETIEVEQRYEFLDIEWESENTGSGPLQYIWLSIDASGIGGDLGIVSDGQVVFEGSASRVGIRIEEDMLGSEMFFEIADNGEVYRFGDELLSFVADVWGDEIPSAPHEFPDDTRVVSDEESFITAPPATTGDITITSCDYNGPSTLESGDSISFEITVENASESLAEVDLEIGIGGQSYVTRGESLPSGSTTFEISPTVRSEDLSNMGGGSHTIESTITLDGETASTATCASVSVILSDPDDYTVEEVSFPELIGAGSDTFDVDVTISNTGDDGESVELLIGSESFVIATSGTNTFTRTVDSPPVGESREYVVEIPSHWTSLSFVAERADDEEITEGDIDIECTSPNKARVGQEIELSASISNNSETGADVTIGVFISGDEIDEQEVYVAGGSSETVVVNYTVPDNSDFTPSFGVVGVSAA